MNKNTRNVLKLKTKTKIVRDFVNNFPTNILKSITFLHPLGVCGWTFHRTLTNSEKSSGVVPEPLYTITRLLVNTGMYIEVPI